MNASHREGRRAIANANGLEQSISAQTMIPKEEPRECGEGRRQPGLLCPILSVVGYPSRRFSTYTLTTRLFTDAVWALDLL